MNSTLRLHLRHSCDRRRPLRRPAAGASSVEVVVAFTLLAAVVSIGTPLVVRHGRLLAEHRDYQRALEEVSNQMERITGLPSDELEATLEKLRPSEFAAETLPGAKLQAKLLPVEQGQRLIVGLTWDARPNHPVSLVAWVYPAPAAASRDEAGAAP